MYLYVQIPKGDKMCNLQNKKIDEDKIQTSVTLSTALDDELVHLLKDLRSERSKKLT